MGAFARRTHSQFPIPNSKLRGCRACRWCVLSTSSIRNRSVSSARRWIDAFRLSTSCELIAGCASTSCTAARASRASRSSTAMKAEYGAWIDVQLRDEAGEKGAQVRERLVALAQELADLTVALIADEPLRRVGEQELVGRFDRVAAALELGPGLVERGRSCWCTSRAARGLRLVRHLPALRIVVLEVDAAAASTRRSCPW